MSRRFYSPPAAALRRQLRHRRMMVNPSRAASAKPPSADIVNRLRPKVSSIPGLRVFLPCRQAIRIGGRMSKSSYDFTLQGPTPRNSTRRRPNSRTQMRRLPGLQDVTTDLQIKTPAREHRRRPRPRRRARSELAQHPERPVRRLRPAAAPPPSTRPPTSTACCWKCSRNTRQHTDDLDMIYLKIRHRQYWFRWTRVAQLKYGRRPAEHPPLRPAALGHDLLQPASPASRWARRPTRSRRPAKNILPATITGILPGHRQSVPGFAANLGILLMVAILVVYIVLGVLYESYVHPLTILSGLPSAGFGALLTLLICSRSS